MIVRHEGVGDADECQSPLREQKHRLATSMIGQRREDHRAEYHADHQNRLRQVLEVFPVADEVPLNTAHTHESFD